MWYWNMERKQLLSSIVLFCCLLPIAQCLIVKTTCGVVKGRVTPEAYAFLGIPYAEPPVRHLRWRSPVTKRTWRGLWDATYLRRKCPQAACDRRNVYGNTCSDKYSEDCLHLNIYSPLGTQPGQNIDVMIFIHGGFFEAGSSVSPLFNGETFVRNGNVILVTINYRVGALGSLWTDPEGIKGNFGIQDQQLAMKWVQQNIRRFGGNPKKVTIFGRSAGASYVGMHLLNRKSNRYFSGAILMSPPFGISRKTTDQVLNVGSSFSEHLHCDPRDTRCMRSRPVEDVLRAQANASRDSLTILQRFVTWEPFTDREVFTDLQWGMRNGLIGKTKRVIVGITADENAQYTFDFYPRPIPISAYRELVMQLLPDQAAAILQRYVPTDPTDTRSTLRYLLDDIVFTCPSRRVAIDLSIRRPGNVYFYVFDNGLTFLQGTNINAPCHVNACHGNENGFLFQTIERLGFMLSPRERNLAYQLTTSWTNFAKTGNPSFPKSLGQTPWLPFLVDHNVYHSLLYRRFMAQGSVNDQDFRGRLCDQFDQNGFYA